MKVKKLENNKIWKEEMEVLLTERLGQIYRRIINKKEIKEMKKQEETIEQNLEKILKQKTKVEFNIYCDYEEIRSAYMNKLLTTYYKEGFKDAIKLIIKNID